MLRFTMAFVVFACANNAAVEPEVSAAPAVVPKNEPSVTAEPDRCPAGGKLSAAINIQNKAKIARDPPLTSFLVPIAKQANLHSLNGLGVFDASGKRLPAQFETLSRWGGHPSDCARPIRYAYARVGATPGPDQAATWTVKNATNKESSPLKLETSKDAWIIDTGAARFTVRRDRFDGISKIELPKLGGFDPLGRGTFYLDHGGQLRKIEDAELWKLELERAGPQVVTVVARGYYPGAAANKRPQGPNASRGIGFTVRLHFFARSAIVRVDHTYYHGQVADWGATGLTNTTVVKRAWMSVTLAEPADKIYARADKTIHTLDSKQIAQVEQIKRTPDKPDVQYAVFSGDRTVEHGERARRPFLAAVGKGTYVAATIARMQDREPQGFTWSNQLNALDVDFTSAPIQIGAARGIWSIAVLDFGRGTPPEAHVDALQLFAERPLLGAPAPAYSNGTGTIGPYAISTSGVAGSFQSLIKKMHENTKSYYERIRITGLQIWPDLPANSCEVEYNCANWANAYYGGGANNYWNWSKPGFDEFFRTGDGDWIHDFPLGEAITFAETIAVRPDHHHLGDSSVAGLAPCYGDAMGYDGKYIEGTNNRRDRCPADYSYNKTLELAYLATGDLRFVDFFEEAGQGTVNIFGAPPKNPEPYLELNLSRLSTQRLEMLSDGAEFARDEKVSELLRSKLRVYADHMLGKTMIDGHACEVGGTGKHDVTEAGACNSVVAWLMPVPLEWSIRTSQILEHEGLLRWALRHAAVSAKNHTGSEKPGSSVGSWKVGYTCKVSPKGEFSSCSTWSGGENDSRFYGNGVVAYLNVFGLALAADPKDPQRICSWLPGLYGSKIGDLSFEDLNGGIWGKGAGQALAFSAEAVAAIGMCK